MTSSKLINAALIVLCSAPLHACGPSEPDAATRLGLSVGNGETEHEPVADNAPVRAIEGGQGGVHVWLSVDCTECEGEVVLTYGVRSLLGGWMNGAAQRTAVSFDNEVAGLTAMLPGASGQAHVGSDVELYGGVTVDDEPVETTVTVHIGSVGYSDSF